MCYSTGRTKEEKKIEALTSETSILKFMNNTSDFSDSAKTYNVLKVERGYDL